MFSIYCSLSYIFNYLFVFNHVLVNCVDYFCFASENHEFLNMQIGFLFSYYIEFSWFTTPLLFYGTEECPGGEDMGHRPLLEPIPKRVGF